MAHDAQSAGAADSKISALYMTPGRYSRLAASKLSTPMMRVARVAVPFDFRPVARTAPEPFAAVSFFRMSSRSWFWKSRQTEGEISTAPASSGPQGGSQRAPQRGPPSSSVSTASTQPTDYAAQLSCVITATNSGTSPHSATPQLSAAAKHPSGRECPVLHEMAREKCPNGYGPDYVLWPTCSGRRPDRPIQIGRGKSPIPRKMTTLSPEEEETQETTSPPKLPRVIAAASHSAETPAPAGTAAEPTM
ncbi:hypothetical protein E4U40_003646 [Claviceps sp. LM458 group G5]|nr:hypothetical protein E4U40_003646 [Claviceps sp. LM458 group G5]